MSFFPYLTVIDCENSIDFYTNAFGFKLTDSAIDESSKIQHAEMEFLNNKIMFCCEGAYGTTAKAPKTYNIEASLNLYMYCENVDDLFLQAKANNAKILKEPEVAFWGDRWCEIEDINGYKWSFAKRIA